jgi:hypothetical protein
MPITATRWHAVDNDYELFDHTLRERRRYRFVNEQGSYAMKRLRGRGVLEDVEVEMPQDGCVEVSGTHVMNPGSPIGVAAINERFNISLPEDVDRFYRKWDGGVLLFREIYPLMSVQEIVQTTAWYLDANPTDLPVALVRFCDLGNSDYLALRLNTRQAWEVIFKANEYPDEDIIINWHEHPGAFLDASFSAWLKRMIETDGWPMGGKWIYPDEAPPPGERIE